MSYAELDTELESEFETKFTAFVKSRGWFCEKIMRTGRRGFPDRFLARKKNGVVLVEAKRSGEDARRQQLKRHKELRDHGVVVYVIDNMDDARRLLY